MKPSLPAAKPSAFRGVFAATVTPMTPGEEIDYPKLAAFTDYLIRAGLHGLIPLGSTGEFYALDPAERARVLEVTLEAAAGRVPVVAGANAGSTRDAAAFARQAEQLGCAGIMLAPPYYSLPRLDELFAHFRAVNSAVPTFRVRLRDGRLRRCEPIDARRCSLRRRRGAGGVRVRWADPARGRLA